MGIAAVYPSLLDSSHLLLFKCFPITLRRNASLNSIPRNQVLAESVPSEFHRKNKEFQRKFVTFSTLCVSVYHIFVANLCICIHGHIQKFGPIVFCYLKNRAFKLYDAMAPKYAELFVRDPHS